MPLHPPDEYIDDESDSPTPTLPYEPRGLMPRVSPFCLGFRNTRVVDGGWDAAGRPVDVEQWWTAISQVPFRISGLMVWGASKSSVITRCQVRSVMHVLASDDPIPLRFFETGLSFAELTSRLCDESGKPQPLESDEFFSSWLLERPDVEPRQLFEFDTLAPGDQVTLVTRGNFEQLVFWGIGAH